MGKQQKQFGHQPPLHNFFFNPSEPLHLGQGRVMTASALPYG
ncbi:hypothetical protein [Halomicronema hongdechloris]|nr:hypothetical protein [Halomicronema hongdechloris]